MQNILFDSHAHYGDSRFDEITENGKTLRDLLIADALSEVKDNDRVGYVVNAGTNEETSLSSLLLAKKYPQFYAAVGFHPGELDELPSVPDLSIIQKLATEDKVVAIGEIGLDYHYGGTDREKQKRYFRAQIELAARCGLPVVIHDRDAHGDTFDILRQYPDVRGVLHSFSGSIEMMTELVKCGWYISFSGVITFKNALRLAPIVAAVPHDRIMIETDCPYLAPHPNRGKLNYSGYLKYTAARAAELLGIGYDELCSITVSNAKCLFGIE